MRFRLREIILWLIVTIWVCLWAVPLSYWYSVGQIRVEDAREGDSPRIYYNGRVINKATISYHVIIRDAVTGEIVSDDSSSPFLYTPNTKRPDAIDLDWWSPKHEVLEPGIYILTTCWTIYGRFYGVVPAKTECISSNIFRIEPNGETQENMEQRS